MAATAEVPLASVALLVIAVVVIRLRHELRGLKGEQKLLDANLGVLRHIVEKLHESNDRFACVRSVARIRSDTDRRHRGWDRSISECADVRCD